MTAHADDRCFLSIAEAGRRLRDGALSPIALTEAVLERIARHDATMRAYITVTGDVALEQARQAELELQRGHDRGPLHGIPISLKDNVATRSIRTSCASLVDPDWVPDVDATVYTRLREAGAILMGKANLFEYAFSMSPAFPPPLNPWNPERTSSGSSSGSAVSVATGMAFGSIGTDTGGSGRSPANVNGVVGVKGTYGRVSLAGVVPLSYSLDHTTVMARSVRDGALMLQAVAGHDPADESSSRRPVPDFSARLGESIRGLRVGRARGYSDEGIDPEVTRIVDTALDVLRDLGATIEDVDLPYVRRCSALQTAILHPEAATVHHDALRRAADRFGETAIMRLDLGNVVPATAYVQAQRVRRLMRDAFRDLLARVEVIVGPALAMCAGRAGTWTTTVGGREIDLRKAGPEYTGIYNLSGMPALVLPAGFDGGGTPVGLQVAGRWFDEARVFQVAHAYEQTTDWHRRRPPLPDRAPEHRSETA